MSAIAKIQDKGQITIPTRLRALAGLNKGDLVEFSLVRGKIVLTPKLVVDRAAFPSADGDYTPAQRRAVDSQLNKALAEHKAGRSTVPFATPDALIDYLHTQARASKPKAKRRKSA